MRVLLTGGGTAGHINPALAIADLIRRNAPGSEIAFVGVRGGREEDLVPREGYPLYFVESVGFSRPLLSFKNLRALRLAIRSPHQAKTQQILDHFRPDIVIGTGGYACWPIVKAAAERGIPTAVHESNAKPGLTVKRLKKYVDRIWYHFESTGKEFGNSEKARRVGNPLRENFENIDRNRAREKYGIHSDQIVVLSFGGSLGADALNAAVLDLMKDCITMHPEVLSWHATGKRNYDSVRQTFEDLELYRSPNCCLFDYFYDMPFRMAAADLVICRAGAMTLSELAALGKPAILVPSPNVANDHQTANAKALAQRNAAVLIPERELQNGELTAAVTDLLTDPGRLYELKRNIRKYADRDAGKRIWREITELLSCKNKTKTK